MKNLNEFVFERLTLNKQTEIIDNIKLPSAYKEEDFPIKTRKKNGDKFQWFKWWEYLMKNGPTSKHDLLTSMNLEPTSYSTQFARLSKANIIIPLKGKDRGKLMAVKPQDWRYLHANY